MFGDRSGMAPEKHPKGGGDVLLGSGSLAALLTAYTSIVSATYDCVFYQERVFIGFEKYSPEGIDYSLNPLTRLDQQYRAVYGTRIGHTWVETGGGEGGISPSYGYGPGGGESSNYLSQAESVSKETIMSAYCLEDGDLYNTRKYPQNHNGGIIFNNNSNALIQNIFINPSDYITNPNKGKCTVINYSECFFTPSEMKKVMAALDLLWESPSFRELYENVASTTLPIFILERTTSSTSGGNTLPKQFNSKVATSVEYIELSLSISNILNDPERGSLSNIEAIASILAHEFKHVWQFLDISRYGYTALNVWLYRYLNDYNPFTGSPIRGGSDKNNLFEKDADAFAEKCLREVGVIR